jgi:glycosyltransferase involved in cell wall biosynthesis
MLNTPTTGNDMTSRQSVPELEAELQALAAEVRELKAGAMRVVEAGGTKGSVVRWPAINVMTRRKRKERDQLKNALLIRASGLFNADWYIRHNAGGLTIREDAALHYVKRGRHLGFEPGPHFSGRKYLERYPDVAAEGFDPLLHYVLHGRDEGREIDGEPLPADGSVVVSGGAQPVRAAASTTRLRRREKKRFREQAALIRESGLFDSDWYVSKNPVSSDALLDAVMHYLREGARQGFDPGPRFSGRRYLAANPDVAQEGLNPLVHYILHGESEGRNAYAVPPPMAFKPNPAPRTALAPSASPVLHKQQAVSMSGAAPAIIAETPSILFVSGEPDTPGNYYRVLYYVEAARANGWRAEWIRGDELALRMSEVSEFDLLMIWRAPWNGPISEAAEIMRGLGRQVIFDCDDLMTEPRFATAEHIDGIRSQAMSEQGVQDFFSLVRQTMLFADVCFTTTDQMAFHFRWADKTTFVNPNGFSQAIHDLARRSARHWAKERDGLVRMGYAGGSRTHQKDLAMAMGGVCRILREHPECRLVLFRHNSGSPLVDIEEYPELAGLEEQIEWRPLQPFTNLPTEMARFDINLAPLEVGNPFCEAKSQLKFFEAGLVNCPTVASPTGPFRDSMIHGETGFLAVSGDDWYASLKQLVLDPALRDRIGRAAYLVALGRFGPRRRTLDFGCVLDQLRGGPAAARSFALSAANNARPAVRPAVYPSTTMFEQDKGGNPELTVIIPLYNYADVVVETLDSVREQTLADIDLVIVDGFSTDKSLEVALAWARRNAARFNRIVVLRNDANYGLGLCRNSGFDAADTPYVLPLDADNRLRPQCCEKLLEAIKLSGAAYVYPTIQHFGTSTRQICNVPYRAQRFTAGNYVDAMALVSKEAWAMIGGYVHVRYGWEDYDFWARLAEIGLAGEWYPEALAEYRVHETSMMKSQTVVDNNYRVLNRDFKERHPWVALVDTETRRYPMLADSRVTAAGALTRLDELLPIMRCPMSGKKLAYDESRSALISHDGMVRWPIIEGRPSMSRDLTDPQVMPSGHISNELPEEALEVIRETKGWVLNLSAGGSRHKFKHVVEMEYAVFRHTDVVGDAHHLPFDDATFDAIVVMNAFEHYHDPVRVAAELRRVLKPGGRLHIRTAFLQPLHEKPYHFYNCTRYGMENWFSGFETELMHVSENFCPNHTLAWVASEAETALRQDVSPQSAEGFMARPIRELVESWRDPAKRDTPLWTDLERLSQDNQDIIAAGFELFARRPEDKPKL